jgi:chromate reductase
VLKNAIDWASRPPKESPLNGKPVAILGAGGVGGTIRSQMHLRQILLFNGCLVLAKPEVYVMRAQEKFDATGTLLDQASRDQIRALLESLAAWVRRLG